MVQRSMADVDNYSNSQEVEQMYIPLQFYHGMV